MDFMTGLLWCALSCAIITPACALPPERDAHSSFLSQAELSPRQSRPSLRGGSSHHQATATADAKIVYFEYLINEQRMIQQVEQKLTNPNVSQQDGIDAWHAAESSLWADLLDRIEAQIIGSVPQMVPLSLDKSSDKDCERSELPTASGCLKLAVNLYCRDAEVAQKVIEGALYEIGFFLRVGYQFLAIATANPKIMVFEYVINGQRMIEQIDRELTKHNFSQYFANETFVAAASSLLSDLLRKIRSTTTLVDSRPEVADGLDELSDRECKKSTVYTVYGCLKLKLRLWCRDAEVGRKAIESALSEMGFKPPVKPTDVPETMQTWVNRFLSQIVGVHIPNDYQFLEHSSS